MGIAATLVFIVGLHASLMAQSSEQEKIIKAYYKAWEVGNWDNVVSFLAADFTFTSPAPDDHIPIEKFKLKCWPQSAHIDHFEFKSIFHDATGTFVIIEVVTKKHKVLRNAEYFTFAGNKIKAIEVFFGGTGAGYPTNAR